jgi:hypothetical protein
MQHQFMDDGRPIFYSHQLVLGREYIITRMVGQGVPGAFRVLALLRSPYEDDLWLLLPRPYCFFFRRTEMRTISRGILRYTLTYHGWYNHSTPNIELVRY